jgi:hypothetical protein
MFELVVKTLDHLGYLLHAKKTKPRPAQKRLFLGNVIDTSHKEWVALRLPPSSRVDAAAYGVPERSHWTPAAALPALAARIATAWPPSPLAELNHAANAAIHRRIKRDGHLHLVRPRTASAQRLLISTPLFLRGCLHLLTERAAHPG